MFILIEVLQIQNIVLHLPINKSQKFYSLTKSNIMTTASQIRKANPQGKMTMDYNGTHQIIFDNGVIFTSASSRDNTNLWNKLLRMGFNRHYNFSSDEIDGLVQASQNGENPFAFSIICSNTSLNGIFK